MSKKADNTKAKGTAEVKKTIAKGTEVTKPTIKSEGESKQMLGAIVKGMKDTILKSNGGVRKLSPEARKSRALKALVGAMKTRQWVDQGHGVYSLNSVKVDTNTDNFTVSIHDGNKGYALQLGKGAIRELDSYMKLR